MGHWITNYQRFFGAIAIMLGVSVADAQEPRVQQRRPSPRQILSGIKTIVEDPKLIRNFPKFSVSLETKEGIYTILVLDPDAETLPDDDPYRLPFDAMLTAYAFRVAVERDTKLDKELLKPRLQQIEDVVYSTIVDIESTPNKTDLNKKLIERRKEIKSLDPANVILGYYGRLGVRFTPIGAYFGEMFVVSVSTDPSNATTRILPYLSYRKSLLLRTPKDQWAWRTLTQQKEGLSGKYHYFVSWPDGRKAEGDLEVRNNSPITFRPN